MKEAPGSSETSVLTRATRRNNPEDTILHSHRRENLKSQISNLKLHLVIFLSIHTGSQMTNANFSSINTMKPKYKHGDSQQTTQPIGPSKRTSENIQRLHI
jgi:hypothetical protein